MTRRYAPDELKVTVRLMPHYGLPPVRINQVPHKMVKEEFIQWPLEYVSKRGIACHNGHFCSRSLEFMVVSYFSFTISLECKEEMRQQLSLSGFIRG